MELIKNLKFSAYVAFSFWAIESIRKRGIDGISRKDQFKPASFEKKSIVKSFNLPKYEEKELSSSIEVA